MPLSEVDQRTKIGNLRVQPPRGLDLGNSRVTCEPISDAGLSYAVSHSFSREVSTTIITCVYVYIAAPDVHSLAWCT